MKITKTLTTLALAATLLPTTAAYSQLSPPNPTPVAENRFDLDFPGGPIGTLVDTLRETSADFPNIIVPASASGVEVPPLTLRNVTLSDLTSVLNEVGRTGSNNEQFSLTRTTTNIWAVVTPKLDEQRSGQDVLFFPISQHIESHSIDDISTTIATAWQMLKLPGDPSSHIKFHEDTKLLIASGTTQMLTVVAEALEALEADGKSAYEEKLLADLEQAKQQISNTENKAKLTSQLNQERSMVVQEDLRKNLAELREENAALRAKLREVESALAATRGSK